MKWQIPSASGAVDRLMSPRSQRILTLLTVCALCFNLSVLPDYKNLSQRFPTEFPTSLSSLKDTFSLPRVVDEAGVNLTSYLDARFPNVPPGAETMKTYPGGGQLGPHVWITMADKTWVSSGALGLHQFVAQLNDERAAKFGKNARRTELVTLCIDEVCSKRCKQFGMYCYGGHRFTKPKEIFGSTWPKLATFIEVLKTRDLFFVDSDVLFNRDPYPLMEQFMKDYDLVVQENDTFDHFNTGWMWLRRGDAVSDAWSEVLARDMVKVSRDQINFNEVLGTSRLRQHHNATYPHRLLEDYVALNGLRVHVLDPRDFYTWHMETAGHELWQKQNSVSMHITCGDDEPTKTYLLKTMGYWPDTVNYFSDPRQLLSIDQLSGTTDEVIKMARIALAVGYYTQRAVQPPTHAVFTDIPDRHDEEELSNIVSLPAYSSFHWSHVDRDFGGKLFTVEPNYAANAAKFLLGGGSVLGFGETRHNLELSSTKKWDAKRRAEAAQTALELLQPVVLDVREFDTLGELLQAALLAQDAAHVRLQGFVFPTHDALNASAPALQLWKEWDTPEPLNTFEPCDRLNVPPDCNAICRFPRENRMHLMPHGEWPELWEVGGVDAAETSEGSFV